LRIQNGLKKSAVAQAKESQILRPGKASEKTPKGVIPPSLCEISQNPYTHERERKRGREREMLFRMAMMHTKLIRMK
jgi:hypothetical protein